MINKSHVREHIGYYIHGKPNENSKDEHMLYREIRKNVASCDNPCHFYFNYPITYFGVPSKRVRIQDYREYFIEFVMRRCLISRFEAIELMNHVKDDAPIRTNTLELDIGKTDDSGVLIAGMESNGRQHYRIPDNARDRESFARSIFADMIKELEVRKIAPLIEVNHCIQDIHGIWSEENLAQMRSINEFVQATANVC